MLPPMAINRLVHPLPLTFSLLLSRASSPAAAAAASNLCCRKLKTGFEPIFVAPVRFASSKAKGGKKAGKVVKDTKETQNVMFEEKIDFVAERWITDDPARHCKFVCINYEAEKKEAGPPLLADADYPEWLWTLDVEVPREVEELDPERDGWRYWEAWDRRRQEQTQRLDHLIYRYIHLQDSPSLQKFVPYSKFEYQKGRSIIPGLAGKFQDRKYWKRFWY